MEKEKTVRKIARPGPKTSHGDRSSGEDSPEEDDDTPEAGTQPIPRDIRPDLHVLTLLLGYSVGF